MRNLAPAGRESAEIGQEIVVEQPSVDLDLHTRMTLQQPQVSIPAVLDPLLAASPGDTGENENQGNALVQSSLGKRKRLAYKFDETPRWTSVNDQVKGPRIASGSEDKVTAVSAELKQLGELKQHAEDKTRFCESNWLNDLNVNDLLEVFGGVDVQTYISFDFKSDRPMEISKDARVNNIALNLKDQHRVGVVMDGTTGDFKFYNSLGPLYTKEIIEAMEHLRCRVTNIELKPPEEVVCMNRIGLERN